MGDYFQHPQALVDEGALVGARTRVWAFAHILGGATVGEDCNICDHTFIEGGVKVGNRVTLKCGVSLWKGLILEDDVFIGPAAVFTNDIRPRSQRYPDEYRTTLLKRGCSIGANSTILPGLVVGQWAMVGAGSVVTHNVADFALVYGNPARRQGWVCRCGEKLRPMGGSKFACSCGLEYEEITGGSLREVENRCEVLRAR